MAKKKKNAISPTREENFFGKYQLTEPSPKRHYHEVIPAEDPSLRILTSQEGASGLTAVWARENTRGDIFDSMRRKEVYATTGTRIRVRVFGGWNFTPEDITTADFASKGAAARAIRQRDHGNRIASGRTIAAGGSIVGCLRPGRLHRRAAGR